MKIDIITIFPEIFFGPFSQSIVNRAIKEKIVDINIINLRDFTSDKRKSVDDKPYGGGPGMLMTPEPIFKAVKSLKKENSHIILTTPQGQQFSQKKAVQLVKREHIIFICGHYEGVDERIRTELVDEEISIGDYILTSGNLPAMVITDAVVRLLPNALGSEESSVEESFSNGLLEYPQFTRPEVYKNLEVPKVLLSGNHAQIADWRKKEAIKRTSERRPDLIKKEIIL